MDEEFTRFVAWDATEKSFLIQKVMERAEFIGSFCRRGNIAAAVPELAMGARNPILYKQVESLRHVECFAYCHKDEKHFLAREHHNYII